MKGINTIFIFIHILPTPFFFHIKFAPFSGVVSWISGCAPPLKTSTTFSPPEFPLTISGSTMTHSAGRHQETGALHRQKSERTSQRLPDKQVSITPWNENNAAPGCCQVYDLTTPTFMRLQNLSLCFSWHCVGRFSQGLVRSCVVVVQAEQSQEVGDVLWFGAPTRKVLIEHTCSP